jgi:signal transduction histidine kinase
MNKIKKLLGLVGPYPYAPRLLFLTIFLCLASRYQVVLFDIAPGQARVKALMAIWIFAAGPGVIVVLMTTLFTKFRRWSSESLVLYVFEIASIILVMRMARFFSQQSPFWKSYVPENAWLPTTWATLTGALFFGLIINALLNYAQKITVGKLSEAQELVKSLSEKRALLIKAEEESKMKLAIFLHDRVQADLMTISLSLKKISLKDEVLDQVLINEVIQHLESMRGVDLKKVIEELSPNFEIGGLKGSLEVLKQQYGSNMSIAVQVDEKSETLGLLYMLAIYRIVEQCLINSFLHGPAKNVFVSVSTDSVGKTEILISDDGPGTDLEFVDSGVGTAVIDSWVGILNGKKTVDTVPGHGYRLVINFPT